jgi:adenosine kinase
MKHSPARPAPIVVSGSIAIDRIMRFGGRYRDYLVADKLDKVSVSIFLDGLTDSRGGVGANIAYSLALLGEEPVLLGAAGKDARLYLEELAHVGVNIKYVHESARPTASFNVITDGEENQVGGFYPGAMLDSASLSLEPWRGSEAIVVVAPHDPVAMARQVAQCREWGLRLCYDVGQQVSNLEGADLAAGVVAAELLVVNEYEMAALAAKLGRTAAEIKAAVPVVVTTLGRDGSVIEGVAVTGAVRVGAVKPAVARDPTGAGDAYRAGLLYGWARGWSWRACGQLGAVCAAYAIEHEGTQGHRFSLAEAAARYREAFGEVMLY